MSQTIASLRRKLVSANKLHSVVRAMKALAASNVGQFEKSIVALSEYSHTVEMALGVCLRQNLSLGLMRVKLEPMRTQNQISIVFGSDQGLVGQFNNQVCDFALNAQNAANEKSKVWAVGERVQFRLIDSGAATVECFSVPSSIKLVGKLVGQILSKIEKQGNDIALHLFYNKVISNSSYAPVQKQILPLDEDWGRKLGGIPWPTKLLPETIGSETLPALIRDYLFISLFRACAESLAAENASRLAAMQRADKNIQDLVLTTSEKFNTLRQSQIDEELFDVISGFETLSYMKSL